MQEHKKIFKAPRAPQFDLQYRHFAIKVIEEFFQISFCLFIVHIIRE